MRRGAWVKLLFALGILPFLGVGCNREELGNFLQTNIISKIQNQLKSAQESALNVIDNTSRNFVKNLNDAQKRAVDDWLKKNKLNQYGDPKTTVYAGGTPLFNEQTGESANRYEFLFNKFPQLKDIVQKALK